MRNTKSVASWIVMAMAGLFATSDLQATELWDPHLRGVDEGLAPGASAPPGVYGVLNNYWASFTIYNKGGYKTDVKLDALIEVPTVLWQTGYKVLGGDFAMAIAQPFDHTNMRASGYPEFSNDAHWGTYNTVIVPAQISWALSHDLHVATALAVYVDDASSSPGDEPAHGGVGSGNGYWTLEPSLGVSWLHNGWNLSMNVRYDYNFKNHKTDYRSGQQIAIDYTATKKIGQWTLGLGAYQENQLNDDSGAGAIAAGCPAGNGCRIQNYGFGPIVGYQFGGLEVVATYNTNLETRSDVGGDFFNLRLVAPLY